MSILALSLSLLGLLSGTAAHSWNEQLSLVASNGSFVANGYPRGYVDRTSPDFSDAKMTWLMPNASTGRIFIDNSDLLCHDGQRTQTQSAGYPRLTVSPGSVIAMKYMENGHVSLPQVQIGKPPQSGTVFVFGTTQPSTDEKLTDVLQWNAAGTGGDKRGVLLQSQNFDDDRCYQINSGAISTQRQQEFPNPMPGQPNSKDEQWCESNAVIPSSAPVGKPYTLYWVWQWPTAPGGNSGYPQGKDEFYSTCNDVDVVANAPQPGFFSNALKQQDPQVNAVSDYKSRSAVQPTPWPLGISGAMKAGITPAVAGQVSSTAGAASSPAAAVPSPASVASPSTAQGAPAPSAAAPVANTAAQAAPATQVAAPVATGANVTPLPTSAYTPVASTPSATQAPAANTVTSANSVATTLAATTTTVEGQAITLAAGQSLIVMQGTQPVARDIVQTSIAPSPTNAHAKWHYSWRRNGPAPSERVKRGLPVHHGRWFGA